MINDYERTEAEKQVESNAREVMARLQAKIAKQKAAYDTPYAMQIAIMKLKQLAVNMPVIPELKEEDEMIVDAPLTTSVSSRKIGNRSYTS